MAFTARPHVLREANLAQLRQYKPNVAVLPWGATEAHNLHLPHGMDNITAEAFADAAVERAVQQGARPILLPCVPYGNDNMQLTQVATITMRSRTQQLVLHDIAESLLRQEIDRLIVLNFHGGNDFKQMIRDIVLDLPMFIVQVNAFQLAPEARQVLDDKGGDHANEYETALALHLYPHLVAPLETAGDGAATPSKIPALSTPGVWTSRNWAALTKDTGVGNPKKATAEKGKALYEATVDALVPIIVQVSAARHGDFPYVIPGRK
jgi:creatinine amidohydrolase